MAFMSHKSPPKIDIKHAAQLSLQLSGDDVLLNYERIMQETRGLGSENVLKWLVHAQTRHNLTGHQSIWLHVTVATTLPLACQRCLENVDVNVQIDRDFRFVGNETKAEHEDGSSEEDVLVLSPAFDLLALIEDEILMDMPLIPRHDICPVDIKMTVADLAFESTHDAPHPFAALSQLKYP